MNRAAYFVKLSLVIAPFFLSVGIALAYSQSPSLPEENRRILERQDERIKGVADQLAELRRTVGWLVGATVWSGGVSAAVGVDRLRYRVPKQKEKRE